MGSKIQGEGDYEAAKRFNKAEQDFVKRKFNKREAFKESDDYSLEDDDDTEIVESELLRQHRLDSGTRE